MEYKLAYNIKKYNSETKKTSFYEDVKDIFSQKILFKKDNFSLDFEMENELKIDLGLKNFQKVYNKKSSSISNQNFIITMSILDEKFFNEIDLNNFQETLYNILNSKFEILSFVVVKDSIGDITFYIICTAIVKEIFLDHVIKKVTEQGKSIDDLQDVLSYNLILGGTLTEKPEEKFIALILKELNDSNYDLVAATESEKQKYILESYNRASQKILNLETDINTLFKELNKRDPRFTTMFKQYIEIYKLKSLEDLFK